MVEGSVTPSSCVPSDAKLVDVDIIVVVLIDVKLDKSVDCDVAVFTSSNISECLDSLIALVTLCWRADLEIATPNS
jgi:hypothetical protein